MGALARRRWLFAAIGVGASSWAACSTPYSGEQADATSDGGDDHTDGPTPSQDVGVADAADGGPLLDGHVALDGAPIDDSFEVGASCDGWIPVNGAAALPVAGGHSGARACLLCAGGTDGAMMKSVLTSGGRTYQALAFLRAPPQDASPAAGLSLSLYAPDGGLTGAERAVFPATAQWTIAQTVTNASPSTSTATLTIGINGTSGCILIDDVSLTKE